MVSPSLQSINPVITLVQSLTNGANTDNLINSGSLSSLICKMKIIIIYLAEVIVKIRSNECYIYIYTYIEKERIMS